MLVSKEKVNIVLEDMLNRKCLDNRVFSLRSEGVYLIGFVFIGSSVLVCKV